MILAFGDSLTAGFGVATHESYPARLQALLKKKGYTYKVVNAGVSGDTTAGGVRRIDWLLKHKPGIVILELGANDGLRGLPLDDMKSNLAKIIETCQQAGAKVILAGMKITPNLGEEYTKGFEDTFTQLAEEYNLPLIPFFLEGVAGVEGLTRPDGIHPEAEGYAIVTETVWQTLEPLLNSK